MTFCAYSPDAAPLRLVSRQELSTQASGVVRGKDLGPALWMGDFTTIALHNSRASEFEAMLDSLDGVIHSFEASDLRKRYPTAYPTGAFIDSGVLNSVNVNNKALSLRGVPAGYVVSPGDYLSFDYSGSRALHRTVEGATANGSGLTTEFEVRPHIRAGWVLSPDTPVKLKMARGLFTLAKDSRSSKLVSGRHSVITFQAIQYL